jgi:hypothetical protein
MANSVKVEIVGGTACVAKFIDLTKKQEMDVIQAIVKSSLNIETDAKRRAPSDLGFLRSGIITRIIQGGFVAEIVGSKDYSGDIEYGSKPHFPPPSDLAGWATRHGMAGLEYIIARSISVKGTKAQPFLIPAWTAEQPNFIKAMQQVCKNLEKV